MTTLARWADLVCCGVFLAACSCAAGDSSGFDTSSSGSATATTSASSGTGMPVALTLRIEPPTVELDSIADETPPTVSFKAFAKRNGVDEEDVTAETQFSLSKPTMGTMTIGELKLSGVGGEAMLVGTYQAVPATASIRVTLTGDVVVAGVDPTLVQQFEGAVPDPTPATEPTVEYPFDGVVLPANLPPFEAQWTQGADNQAYRVRLRADDVLDLAFYTTSRELLFPKLIYKLVAQTSPDQEITLTVDGLGPGSKLRKGKPQGLIISEDTIDDTSIYVWQSSTASFRVLDITAGTEVALPTNASGLGSGGCGGCHRISRDGKRFSYVFADSFQAAALRYDEPSQTFVETIVPTPGVKGTFAAFNPLEDSTTPAMLLTVPDDVPENSPGTSRLQLVHPETLAPVASNLADALSAAQSGTLMPDWSPDGSFVVFTTYDSTLPMPLLGLMVASSSLMEMPVTYDAGTKTFQFGSPKTLVAPPVGSNADTGPTHFLPAISPDGLGVAYTRANGYWLFKSRMEPHNQSSQIMLVRRSDGHVFELVRGSNEREPMHHSTWPQWAPQLGKKYAWIAYSSQRPYGHRLTPESPENAQCTLSGGQRQCKQLWVMAIDRDAFAKGAVDPSRPPFWIPGQKLSAQYVSPQWTKSVPLVPQ